ncbi:TIGR03618 family F420-dependent PPOX class oxidoreductase [Streptomyces sp. NBC_01476]|uniref:TIGR03618 family F420-dependent PPOX class oxidoreductase n=1 Tax=Streptomyces sp. NBC_01476 TaxID=2903881 RepID=UPI002E3780A5|nr:TIGR03618 family F420-dependent PPOX class oxidoreductase [Streptomyces sp. NBC_01476]
MATLNDFADLARSQQGLGVVSTLRADLSIQSSVVNLAVMGHPVAGADIVAFVTYGKVKLANLRVRPRLAVAVRSGWKWATVEGAAELIGPDDPHRAFDAERVRLLLREIFVAAGGTHDNWDAYDRTMAADRRAAVLVRPDRVYGNA